MTRAICLVVLFVVSGQVTLAAERVLVLVLPFEAASPEVQWVGKGVQQTVVSELSAVPSLSVVGRAQGVSSPDAAVSAGREAGAAFVVIGGVQGVEAKDNPAAREGEPAPAPQAAKRPWWKFW